MRTVYVVGGDPLVASMFKDEGWQVVEQLVGELWTAFGVVYTQTERGHKQTAKFLTKMGFQKAGPFYHENSCSE